MKNQNKQIILILFIFLSILVSIYVIISSNKQDNLNSKEGNYYETFGESCLDRVTDEYLRNVCEKINDSTKRDSCYYDEGISTGYARICKLIENKTSKQKCFIGVNKTLLDNPSLKQRAEKYNPNKREI